MRESDYKAYKKELSEINPKYRPAVDWDELEKFGMSVERTAKPDEDVKSIYELSVTEIPDTPDTIDVGDNDHTDIREIPNES